MKNSLKKIKKVWSRLPNLKFVVLLEGESQEKNIYTWEDILTLGEEVSDTDLRNRISKQKSEDLATLVYTSGTTSNPKAVMLTHQNLTWTAANMANSPFQFSQDDEIISYLPLSHIAEQMTTIHGPVVTGASVSFAESFEKTSRKFTRSSAYFISWSTKSMGKNSTKNDRKGD